MHPTHVAPHLPEFAQAWCQALYEIRDNEEKDSAFRGLCTMVQTNPAGIAKVRLVYQSCCLTDCLTESSLVLQLDCTLDDALVGAKPDVPNFVARFQAT